MACNIEITIEIAQQVTIELETCPVAEKWRWISITLDEPTTSVTHEKLAKEIDVFISIGGQATDYAAAGIVHNPADNELDFSTYGAIQGLIRFKYKVQ